MMEGFIGTQFNFYTLLIYILFGVIFYGITILIDQYFWHKLAGKNWFELYWTRLKITIWVLFIISVFHYFSKVNFGLTMIIFGLTLALGWSIWKNLFAGFYIKFLGTLKPGDSLIIDNIEGEIINTQWMDTTLTDQNGIHINIPNGIILKNKLTSIQRTNVENIYSFEWETNDTTNSDEITTLLKFCPYLNKNQEVKVKRIAEGRFQISASLISPSFKRQVLDYLGEGLNITQK